MQTLESTTNPVPHNKQGELTAPVQAESTESLSVENTPKQGKNPLPNKTQSSHILNVLPTPVLIVSKSGKIRFANDKAKSLLCETLNICHNHRAVKGNNLYDLLNKKKVRKAIKKSIREQAEIHHSFKFRPFYSAQKMYFEMQVTPLGKRGVIAIQDVTPMRQMDKIKSDFISNASHELRTPLTSITGFIETLQTSAKGDPATHEKFLKIMAENTGRMANLLDDLSRLSSIEFMEHTMPQDCIPLATTTQSVADALAIQAGEKSITITHTINPDHCVIGDGDQIFRIIANTVENAIKYGRTGGWVKLWSDTCVIKGANYITLYCQDNGIGINPDHIPRLTERFYRVKQNAEHTATGSGLGLAIVKHLVARHRGVFRIESTPDIGSTMVISLPLPPDCPPQESPK